MRTLEQHLTAARATADPVPAPVRWAFYLFLFSLPFEYPDRTIPVETTTLTGAIFIGTALLWPRRCLRSAPRAVWLFVAYGYVFWAAVAVGGGFYAQDAIKSTITLTQMILVIALGANLFQEQDVRDRALLAFAAAVVILALMTLLHIMTKPGVDDVDAVRMTALGQNPNRAARILGGGILVLIGMAYAHAQARIRPRWLVWPFVGVIALALIQGGSRGGLLALTIGLLTFAVGAGTLKSKLRNGVVAVLAVGLVVMFAMRSPLIQERVMQAREGNFAQREQIFPSAVAMFRDRPLLGWGAENDYELAKRMPYHYRTSRDAHNLVLHILTTAGLLGALPFFGALFFAVLAAWRGRHGPVGALPLALLIALLAGNMSGNYIALKLQWVAVALAFACGAPAALRAPVRAPGPRRLAAPLTRPI